MLSTRVEQVEGWFVLTAESEEEHGGGLGHGSRQTLARFHDPQELVDYVRHLERVETNREALAWAETLAPTIWQRRNRAWWRLEMVIKRRRKELFGHV